MSTDAPPAARRVSLDDFALHAGTVHTPAPLTVESIAQTWAYVVSVELPLAQMALTLPVLVTASVVVTEGLVDALVVGDGLTSVLSRARLPARVGRRRLDIVLQQLSSTARLVFRNCTPADRCCRFTVESVFVQPAGAEILAPPTRLAEVTETDPTRINMARLRAALRASLENA